MNRRGFITGLATALVAAPAIVRAGSLMPVKLVEWNAPLFGRELLPLYGVSPAMESLRYFDDINRIRRDLIDRLINPPIFSREPPAVWFRGIPVRMVDSFDD